MSTISRSKTWVTGDVLTAADLNGEFNVIHNDYNGSINHNNLGTIASTVTWNVSTNVDLIDLTKSGSGTGGILDISDAGTGTSIDIDKTGDGIVLDIAADSVTTSTVATVTSNSSSTSTRDIVKLVQDHASATGATLLRLQQDSTGACLVVST